MTIEPRDPTLRTVREIANLKQREVGKIVHIDSSTISQWERTFPIERLRLYQIQQFVEGCGGKVKLIIEIDGKEIIR